MQRWHLTWHSASTSWAPTFLALQQAFEDCCVDSIMLAHISRQPEDWVLWLLGEEPDITIGMLRRRVLLELKRLWSLQPVLHLQWQWCALFCVPACWR